MEKFELIRDEISIVPSSVELLVNKAIRDLIKSGVEGDKLLNSIIRKYNNVGVPFETLLRFLFDYCKDDFNIREFLSDTYRTELDEVNQITEDYFTHSVGEIRDEYFAKKGNFSKFEELYDILEEDIDRIRKNIHSLEKKQRELPVVFDEDEEGYDENLYEEYEKYDNKILLLDDRIDELDHCKYDISNYMGYSNDEMQEFELVVYQYIGSKILGIQTLNENDFYSLFTKMISKKGWSDAPDSLKYEIMRKIVVYAKTKGIQVDFNKLLEMNENTNIKKKIK